MIVPPKRQDAAAARPPWRRRGIGRGAVCHSPAAHLSPHPLRTHPAEQWEQVRTDGKYWARGGETRKRGGTHKGEGGRKPAREAPPLFMERAHHFLRT